ncbi:hypothetical protein [Mycobacterium tuberculosis]|uniref:hypothetical protein n=1 Tax=Mycobacterium tuberculosis TaxID=1773 RepID=UPI0032B5C753
MAGEWSSKELTRVLTVLAGSVDELVPLATGCGRSRRPFDLVGQTTAGQARRNIAVHYDLSNDLFAAFSTRP